jgi:hypothetical protein
VWSKGYDVTSIGITSILTPLPGVGGDEVDHDPAAHEQQPLDTLFRKVSMKKMICTPVKRTYGPEMIGPYEELMLNGNLAYTSMSSR